MGQIPNRLAMFTLRTPWMQWRLHDTSWHFLFKISSLTIALKIVHVSDLCSTYGDHEQECCSQLLPLFQNPCRSNPCKEDMICQAGFTSKGFRCQPIYTGQWDCMYFHADVMEVGLNEQTKGCRPELSTLNKWSECVSSCRHRNKALPPTTKLLLISHYIN